MQAAVYYVDQSHPTASDSNDGSESSPWLTFQKGASTAIAGDTVYVKNGTYNEIVSVENSGTSGNPIIFREYPGDTVILDGTGHAGWYGIFSIYGKSYIKLEDIEVRNNSTGWAILIEHDGSNVSSYIEFLNLEVHHTGGECIQIRGDVNNIVIQNCVVHDSTSYSGIDMYQWSSRRPHHVTVTGCTVYNCPGFAGIASEQADNLIIEDNTTYDSSLGIDIGSGDNNIIRRNIVRDCDTGIAVSSNEDSEIYNNTIYNIYDEAIYCYYWISHGEGHARNKWYNNIVHDAGFAVYESNRKSASYDPGPTSNHAYYNNLFYNVGTGSYRTPFYFRGTTDLKFHNNTMYLNDSNDAVEFLEGAINADVRNNIISISGSKSCIIMDSSSTPGSVVDYNCYHNRSGSSSGPGTNSITGDPLFISVPGSDYHLQSSSPCIDRGIDLSMYFTGDLDGNSRPGGAGWDIGAYEFVSASTPTFTPTDIFTLTSTPVNTATPVPTQTPTNTASITPLNTNTPRPTLTNTPTSSFTASPTINPTRDVPVFKNSKASLSIYISLILLISLKKEKIL